MTKNEYMLRLFNALAPLPQMERNKIMCDYEAHFTEEINAGKNEAMIIYELGSPESAAEYFVNIGKEDHGYNDNFTVEASVIKNNTNTAHSWEAVIWGTLSIFIVPILFVLMIVLFAIGSGLLTAGFVGAAVCFIASDLSVGFILLGIGGLFLAIFGIFMSILAIYDGSILMGKYFKYIRKRIKYGGKNL